ncbi:hypothetical protein EYZ11_013154 [Aspergillus tanneri]|uniref:Uncharacterized protein n=1 Tax=Aspergillus tanneri TaxID=1220188 RepID=A0A4S3J3U0_9EURO|nr:hypothetical protein EYZ11_013154 [Aspergillus tanneri]
MHGIDYVIGYLEDSAYQVRS